MNNQEQNFDQKKKKKYEKRNAKREKENDNEKCFKTTLTIFLKRQFGWREQNENDQKWRKKR